ncbi:hypothetical protein TRFO_27442 [Tritrichomonas foetus]|uniref:Protein kinase domain-containing protein n=1 Tax=Tritrichomonas foetus TaxID=1144522 RepID=A0A1J4K5E3_9EUKA|nr:hypothetical protein TRFO_27442 [Tritrichomonas foetus]|eukprot:OHT04940.1 hypothetical protein TRFO_27442 [Tritrichomonas foetus]
MLRSELIHALGDVGERISHESDIKSNSGAHGSNIYIQKFKCFSDENADPNYELKMAMKNVYLLHLARYPSVVQLKEYDFPQDDDPSITLEYCVNKSIYDYISGLKAGTKKGLHPISKLIIIYGISRAINYLHKNHITHNSLNSRHVLLDQEFKPRITHFVDAAILMQNHTNEEKRQFEENCANDVKAIGIIFYEILTNDVLQENTNLIFSNIENKYYRKIIQQMTSQKYKIDKFVSMMETLDFWLSNEKEERFRLYKTELDQYELNLQKNENKIMLDILKGKQLSTDSNSLSNTNINSDMVSTILNKKRYVMDNLSHTIFQFQSQSNEDNSSASFHLGIAYLTGVSIPKNFGLAYYYICKAMENTKGQGEQNVINFIASIQQYLMDNEINEKPHDQRDSQDFFNKGQIYEKYEQIPEAIASYKESIQKAIDTNLDYTPAIGRLGALMIKTQNMTEQGEEFLKYAAEHDDPYACFCLAKHLMKSSSNSMTETALKLFQKCVDFRLYEALFYLGFYYIQNKQKEKAIDIWTEAKEVYGIASVEKFLKHYS